MKKIRFLKRPTPPKNPWEAGFGRILTPLEEFTHSGTNSGLLLIVCTVIALLLANSSFADNYYSFLKTYFVIGTENHNLKMSIHHWINDGLMAFFFFLVGLEIKREVLVGELSVLKQALLPVCAAIGGMVVPALLYHSLNQSGAAVSGWGIPMATDIAFAVAALILLGDRVPKGLITFLVALAIVDDMGAVLVIAIFYTSELNISALIGAGLVFLLLIAANIVGIKKSWVYGIIGFVMWIFMYKSGIHATVAGILTAIAVPSQSKYLPKEFSSNARRLLDKFDFFTDKEGKLLKSSHMNAVLQTLERGINRAQTPLQNMEHAHHTPVNFIIIPIFALANAGIPVDMSSFTGMFADSISFGVILGLVVGKPLGIFITTWLAIKTGLCKLPMGVNMKHILGAGMLAGIGFTMSIFIAELAFEQEILLINAKTGILIASFVSAIIGFSYLWFLGRKQAVIADNLSV